MTSHDHHLRLTQDARDEACVDCGDSPAEDSPWGRLCQWCLDRHEEQDGGDAA